MKRFLFMLLFLVFSIVSFSACGEPAINKDDIISASENYYTYQQIDDDTAHFTYANLVFPVDASLGEPTYSPSDNRVIFKKDDYTQVVFSKHTTPLYPNDNYSKMMTTPPYATIDSAILLEEISDEVLCYPVYICSYVWENALAVFQTRIWNTDLNILVNVSFSCPIQDASDNYQKWFNTLNELNKASLSTQ